MSAKVLTGDDVTALEAWVFLLGRVKLADRTLVGLLAMSDLGNLPIVACTVHEDTTNPAHTFSSAVAHMRTASSSCILAVDPTAYEVES